MNEEYEFKTNGLFGKDRRYYRWNDLYKEIEMYDTKGRNLCSIDPVTADQVREKTDYINIALVRLLR
jgi:hypothetical protein